MDIGIIQNQLTSLGTDNHAPDWVGLNFIRAQHIVSILCVCENIVKTKKPNLLEWAQKNKVPSDLGEATLTEFLVDFVAYCALKLQ